jgi:two-component system, cell cycle sensor histidine kinase DivJ
MALCHDPAGRALGKRAWVEGKVKPSQPIGEYLDALVHPSAREDALVAVRHRAFITPRMIASLIALAALPVFLAVRGVPSVLEFIILVWSIVPIATACYLSRTGRYESAHLISALALTSIATTVVAYSGGINSIAAIWLVLIPLEAAVSASRRVVAVAAMLALGGAALLLLVETPADMSGSAHHGGALAGLGIVSALLYATGIALGAERVARANARLLVAEEERCRLLAGNMTDVITRHGANGRVLFASANAQAVLGIAASELHGLGLFDRIHIGDRPAFLTALSNAAANGLACSVEFRIRQAKLGDDESRFVWIEMRCKPLDAPQRPNGGFAGREVVAVMRDVSMQKVQQQALFDARVEAERGNAAKSRFLAVMSHELRTPLNAVIGFSEMLINAEQLRIDDEHQREYVRLINDSGAHLLAVVNGILDVSRLETGDFEIVPEPFKPAAVIEGCRELLALKAKDLGVALQCKALPELPDIVADKRAVKQILINLLANALKFTNRGGTVTIDAVVDGQYLVVSVEDTGIGIAPEHFGRLGDPFFQVRGSYARTHDGAGLGLSIVKGLVKLHGGEVDVRSRVGEGTRVAVRLPLDCERRHAPEPVRKIGRPGDAQYPDTPPFTATATRFKAAIKKSA